MAIYQATYLQPRNTAIDATDSQIFSCIIQGTQVEAYELKIYDNSDNSLDYTTAKVTLPSLLHNRDTLEVVIPANTLVNGKEYKWQILTYEYQDKFATSSFALFRANSDPVVSISNLNIITTYDYTFLGAYTQAQNVPLNYFYFIFYDQSGSEILVTNKDYSGRVEYTYKGFVNKQNYLVQIKGQTENGVMFETPKYNFYVDFPQSDVSLVPTIAMQKANCGLENSFVQIDWGKVVQGEGVASGPVSYPDGVFEEGSKSLLVDESTMVGFEIDFPEDFSLLFEWTVSSNAPREIIRIAGNQDIYLSYNGTYFIFSYGALVWTSPAFDPTSKIFLIGVDKMGLRIKETNFYWKVDIIV